MYVNRYIYNFCNYFLYLILNNLLWTKRDFFIKLIYQFRVNFQNFFFDNLLYPLIMFCQREDITLILIHESTFDFVNQKNRFFFYKLYERILALNINLFKSSGNVIAIISKNVNVKYKILISRNKFLIQDMK